MTSSASTSPPAATPSGTVASATVPPPGPATHFGTLTMTREALQKGIGFQDGIYARLAGHDISRFQIGLRQFAAVTHPDYVERILYTHVDRYDKSADYEPLDGINGLSIFSDNGESWRRHRMMLNPMFARRHLNTVYDLMVEPVKETVAALPEQPAEIEMDELLVQLTLQVIGSALFHQSFDRYFPNGTAQMVSEGLRGAFWFSRFLFLATPPDAATDLMWRVFHSPVPVPPPISTTRASARSIHTAINAILDDRAANPTDTADLLNTLLAARDEHGAMTSRRVLAETTTAMLAGHETTANALAWTLYLLSENPDARDRLIEEVDTVLQGRAPTLDDLAALEWTTACLDEGMRCFPPAYMQSRVATVDDDLGGERIKAGTTVWIPAYAIHHDPRWWDDPETYDPSRFLPGADEGRPRCAYVPFSGGRRVCIGRSLAMMEMVSILAMFHQTHTFDLVPGHPIEPEANFTLRPRHGVRMIARPRG